MLTLGIDESGKGPIIGSLFIVGLLMNEKDIPKLKKLGVKDSKLLSHKKRIELAEKIKDIAKGIKIIEIKPDEIDDAIDGNNTLNLNWLEAHKIAEIINQLNSDRVILDCPSPNIQKYKNYVKNLLNNKNIELIVEHKADVNYLECSGSSIIAKVMRENQIKELKNRLKIEFGSGYSSDPITQKFIKENFDKHPEIFRKSWSTWKNHNNNKKQKKLDEF